MINVEAPITGPEVVIAGYHSQSIRIHLVMREDVACRGEGALERRGSTLDDGIVHPGFPIGDTAEGVISPTSVCLPAPACGEDRRVPEGESEFAEQGVGEEVVLRSRWDGLLRHMAISGYAMWDKMRLGRW